MTGIIILAAGESGRLGKPKQNLLYQGQTLLQQAINHALNSHCKPVMVILGAYSDIIQPPIQDESITIVHNPDWHEGMASSIRLGVSALQQISGVNQALIMLCDQPFVDTTILNSILQTKQASRKGIVACAYNNTLGAPVLFGKQYFPELMELKGHDGAKKLLAVHHDDIAPVLFPLGAVDIDTMDDYKALEG